MLFGCFPAVQGAFGQDPSDAIRFRLTNTSTGHYDEAVIRFEPGASAAYDGAYDVHKVFDYGNDDAVIFTKTEEGRELSLNVYPSCGGEYSIDIYTPAPASDSFLLECEINMTPGANIEVFMEDLGTGRVYECVPGWHAGFQGMDIADSGSRFRVHFSEPASARKLKDSCPGMNSGMAVLADPGNYAFTYTLYDAAGNTVAQAGGLPGVDTLTGLAPGAYVAVTGSPYGTPDSLALFIDAREDIQFEGTITHVSEKGLADGAIDLAVSGPGPFAFRWFDGPDTEDREGLYSGQYQVTITDAASCAKKVIFHVEYPDVAGEEPPASISLLWFRAVNEHDSAARLEWATASEFLSDFFTVERLNCDSIWEEVAVVDGAGMSASVCSYSTVDQKPLEGMSFYRLKQTDLLDAVVYSDTVCVSIGTKAGAGFSKLELLSFTASANSEGQVVVQWTAAETSDDDYFTIERSVDNQCWDEVQRVEGRTDSAADTITYTVVDEHPPVGVIYYRLEQTSPGGTPTHSEIALVQKHAPDAMGMKVYPIPASIELFVEGVHPGHTPMIQDQCGKMIMLQGILNGETLSYDVSRLSEGVYFITAGTPETADTRRFVVLK